MKRTLLTTLVVFETFFLCHATRYGVYCFLDYAANHLYEDDVVKVVIAPGDNMEQLQLAIYNKTNSVIYVDKENSFAYINNVPTTLFSNSVYSIGYGTEDGTAVNLGGIASALGIRGGIGSIMGGITVGSGSTQTNSRTIYEKRIVSVAPQSVAILYDWKSCRKLLEETQFMNAKSLEYGITSYQIASRRGYFMNAATGKKTKLRKGISLPFNSSNSPLKYKAVIKYSQTEDFASSQQVTIDNYLSVIVIDNFRGVKNFGKAKTPYCTPYMNQPCIRFVSGSEKSQFWAILMAMLGVGAALFSISII